MKSIKKITNKNNNKIINREKRIKNLEMQLKSNIAKRKKIKKLQNG